MRLANAVAFYLAGAVVEPPASLAHKPAGTLTHSLAMLSFSAWLAQPWLAVPQSFSAHRRHEGS